MRISLFEFIDDDVESAKNQKKYLTYETFTLFQFC